MPASRAYIQSQRLFQVQLLVLLHLLQLLLMLIDQALRPLLCTLHCCNELLLEFLYGCF